MKTELFSVWEGCYESFEAAGGDLEVFDSEQWVNKQKDSIIKQNFDLSSKNLLPEFAFSNEYPLSLVLAMLLNTHSKLTILDFGGGMGKNYLELLAKLPEAKEKIYYLILENKGVIMNLPNEIKEHKNLSFYDSLSDIQLHIDIVHIGSCLQYIKDWKGILNTLGITFSPKYILLSDLLAGNIKSFVSHQIYYNKKIPHWFLNYNEVLLQLKDLGYKKIYHSYFLSKILNQEQIFPNFNLPKDMQISRALNVVFEKNE